MVELITATMGGPTESAPLRVDMHTQHVPRGDGGAPVPVRVVRVAGEVDLATTAQLAEVLADAHAPDPDVATRRVVVDAGAMTFCGARGLAALSRGAELAAECDTVYAVAGLSPMLARMLTELWPASCPSLYPDRAAAVTAVALGARWPTRMRRSAAHT